MLGQLEQEPLFNAMNFSRSIYVSANFTVAATGIATLWCPSDPTVEEGNTIGAAFEPLQWKVRYASYAGCTGRFFPEILQHYDNQGPLKAKIDGAFNYDTSYAVSAFLDGTSMTFLFGERAHGMLSDADRTWWHWWSDSVTGDTLFWTLYPLNPHRKIPNISGEYSAAYISSASSFHPEGANFAFADGSVKFIKTSIDTWPFDPVSGYPVDVSITSGGIYVLGPNARPGVYQALSTRATRELISADSY
jgi:prepilin-type processing-associated H-X9-DG protein